MALDCQEAFVQEMEQLAQINKKLSDINKFLGSDKNSETTLYDEIRLTNEYLKTLCLAVAGKAD